MKHIISSVLLLILIIIFFHNIGWTEETEGETKLDKRITHIRKELYKNPNDAKLHNALGDAYFEKEYYNLAEDEFKEAIKLNPDYSLAHRNLGVIYHIKGKYQEAIEEYNKCIVIEHKNNDNSILAIETLTNRAQARQDLSNPPTIAYTEQISEEHKSEYSSGEQIRRAGWVESVLGRSVVGRITYTCRHRTLEESINASSVPIPGTESAVRIVFLGQGENKSFNLLTDFHYNEWDKQELDNFLLSVKLHNHILDFGDFYQKFDQFSIYNKRIRGLQWRGTLHNKDTGYTRLSWSIGGGETRRPFELGEKIPKYYERYEASGRYQQMMGGGRLEFRPISNLMLGTTFLYAFDDSTSIEEVGTLHINDTTSVVDTVNIRPINNTVYGIHSELGVWEQNLLFRMMYRHSNYDKDIGTPDIESKSDYAYRGEMLLRINEFRLLAMYQYLGNDFHTEGYPYLETDKQGYKLDSYYLIRGAVQVNAKYEFFQRYLEDTPKPKTDVNIIGIKAKIITTDIPQITLSYEHRDEKSDLQIKTVLEDTLLGTIIDTTQINKTTSRFNANIGYNMSDRLRLSLFYSLTNVNDKSTISNIEGQNIKINTYSANIRMNIANRWVQTLGIVWNHTDYPTYKQDYYNPFGTSEFRIIERKLKLEVNWKYIKSKTEEISGRDYTKFSTKIGLRYYLNNALSITPGYEYQRYDHSDDERDYNASSPEIELMMVF